jgi:hypothetical protein
MGMKKYSHHINRNTKQHKKLWVLKDSVLRKKKVKGKKKKKKKR